MSRVSGLTAVALVALCPSIRLAAQAPDTASAPPAPSVVAARLDGDIHLDGILDEPAWAEAVPTTGLTQRDPDEGALPTEQTEIRVLLGGDALYVGARLSDHDALTGPRPAHPPRRHQRERPVHRRAGLPVRPAHRVRLRGEPARRPPGRDPPVGRHRGLLARPGLGRGGPPRWLGLVGRDPHSPLPGALQPRRRHLGRAVHPLHPAPGRGGRLRLRAQDRAREREPVRPAHRARGPAGHPSRRGCCPT